MFIHADVKDLFEYRFVFQFCSLFLPRRVEFLWRTIVKNVSDESYLLNLILSFYFWFLLHRHCSIRKSRLLVLQKSDVSRCLFCHLPS